MRVFPFGQKTWFAETIGIGETDAVILAMIVQAYLDVCQRMS